MLLKKTTYKVLTASTKDSEVDSSLMVSFSVSSAVVVTGSGPSSLTLMTVSGCGRGATLLPSLVFKVSTGTVLATGTRRGRGRRGATVRPFSASSSETAS